MRLFILLVLSILVSINSATVYKFDHFTVRNTADKSCFVYVSGTTDDSTQTDLGKCKAGCGGSIQVNKAKNSNTYIFNQFNGTDCDGDAVVKGGFKCPDPSIDPVKVAGTDFTIKCGTNPKSKVDDQVDAQDTKELDTSNQSGATKSKPKSDGNEIAGFSDEDSDQDASSSKAKPKSPKSAKDSADETAEGASAANENDAKTKDDGNSAASTVASVSLVLFSLIATLTL